MNEHSAEQEWPYTLTEPESARWRQGDIQERIGLIQELGPWLFVQAKHHGYDRFAVYDTDGSLLARGGVAAETDARHLHTFNTDDYTSSRRLN